MARFASSSGICRLTTAKIAEIDFTKLVSARSRYRAGKPELTRGPARPRTGGPSRAFNDDKFDIRFLRRHPRDLPQPVPS
jgi:hypothetical protein